MDYADNIIIEENYMSSVTFTIEPTNRGTDFHPREGYGTRSSTHTLSKSPSHNQEPDIIEISSNAREKLAQENENKTKGSSKSSNGTEKTVVDQKLPQEEQKEVEKLKKIDRKVKSHELAHKAAAGGLARGGASFKYATGPDGKRYAVGGHVNIDTSPIPNDPEATIHKAQVVRSAALAPADPSPEDRAVAASAVKMEREARMELREEQKEDSDETTQVSYEENTTDVNSLLQDLIQSYENPFHSIGSVLDIQA
ncbi:MAG: putative metalloprotease CJM1_0395 family protein [Candidatus Scalinduaceae bacterium]